MLIWVMALSRIWAAFILVSIVVAAVRYVFVPADKEIFSTDGHRQGGGYGPRWRWRLAPQAAPAEPVARVQKADGIIGTCSYAVTLAIGLIGIMALFMGLVSIAEAAGGMRFLARITGPFFSKLFPDVPPGHPAMGHMVMNFSANLLGLDNAATPFALKAMESLQEINPDKTTGIEPANHVPLSASVGAAADTRQCDRAAGLERGERSDGCIYSDRYSDFPDYAGVDERRGNPAADQPVPTGHPGLDRQPCPY